MSCRAEVLLFDCHQDDVAVVRQASASGGPVVRVAANAVEVAHHAVLRRPAAVFIGIGKRSLRNLDVIPMIRAAHEGLPVIVIVSTGTPATSVARRLTYASIRSDGVPTN